MLRRAFLHRRLFRSLSVSFKSRTLAHCCAENFLLTRWWYPWANYILMMLWKGTLYSRVEAEGQFQLVAIHAWSYNAGKLDLYIILVSLVHCRPSIIECIFNSITWVYLPWKKERQLSLVSRYFAQPRSKPSVGLYVVCCISNGILRRSIMQQLFLSVFYFQFFAFRWSTSHYISIL